MRKYIITSVFAAILTGAAIFWFWPADKSIIIGNHELWFHREHPESVLSVGDSFAVYYSEFFDTPKIAHGGISLEWLKSQIKESPEKHYDTVYIFGGVANQTIHGKSEKETLLELLQISRMCIDKFSPNVLICFSPQAMIELGNVPEYQYDGHHINPAGYNELMKSEPVFALIASSLILSSS